MGRAVKDPTQSVLPRQYRLDSVSILSNLIQRDFDVCLDIYEHRFLTSTQIFQLHFPSYSRARVRLHELYLLGILNRFRPPKRPGSWPWHYVLDKLGADIASDMRNIDAHKLYFRKNRQINLLNSPRLSHMRDINEFFCRLVYASRQENDYDLAVTSWLGEASSAALCQGIVRPDGVASIQGPWGKLDFYLELDRGTEDSSRLQDKMIDYDEAAISSHLPKLLLFCFPNSRRERNASRALRSARLTVATSTLESHLDRPLDPIWLPLNGEKRLCLGDLQP
ncbi:MAG: replication-relaxation family protein [Actinomycetota bacterium]